VIYKLASRSAQSNPVKAILMKEFSWYNAHQGTNKKQTREKRLVPLLSAKIKLYWVNPAK
jgi:hypothetical protein